jgi:hypothetical protein
MQMEQSRQQKFVACAIDVPSMSPNAEFARGPQPPQQRPRSAPAAKRLSLRPTTGSWSARRTSEIARLGHFSDLATIGSSRYDLRQRSP